MAKTRSSATAFDLTADAEEFVEGKAKNGESETATEVKTSSKAHARAGRPRKFENLPKASQNDRQCPLRLPEDLYAKLKYKAFCEGPGVSMNSLMLEALRRYSASWPDPPAEVVAAMEKNSKQ